MATENRAEKQARAQVESIAAMVAALECDYTRLNELREDLETACFDESQSTDPNPRGWISEVASNAEHTYHTTATEFIALESAAGDCTSEEEAREAIEQDPLAVEIRSNWHTPGETGEPEEFRIVLCTGGPHVEIVGAIDRGQPSRPRILYQDWGASGELFDFDREAVLTYCRVFYFGE